MPPATRERRAPARPGRNSPHLQKSGLRGSFSLSAPELGARGAGVPGCYGRFDVPGVDLSCTWRGRAMYPGRFSAGSGRARPPRGRGGWRWGCVAVHRHARRGPAARGISGLDPDAVPALRGALAALACGGQAGLPAPCARAGPLPAECAAGRATARQAPGRRGNVGDGLAGHVPASARLTRFTAGLPGADAGGLRPGCRSGNRGRSAKRADRSAGFANRRPFRSAG